MRGMRDLNKIKTFVNRLKRLNVQSSINSLRCALPDMALPDGFQVYLPTREYYEYVLMRLIAVHKIYEKVMYQCVAVAKFFFGMLYMNYFFSTSLLLTAVVSKLNTLTIKLSDIHSDLYNELLRYRLELPKNPNLAVSPYNRFTFESQRRYECAPQPTVNFEHTSTHHEPVIDMGVEVERARSPKSVQQDQIEQLQTVEQVKIFIKTENRARKTMKSKAITNTLQEKQWRIAIKSFNHSIRTNCHRKDAVRAFRRLVISALH